SHNTCDGPVDFEALLYEGQDRVDMVYGTMTNGGVSATVGLQRGIGPQVTQFSCNTSSLTSGLLLSFTEPACFTPTPIPTNTPTATPTETFLPTPAVANLVGHVTWQQVPQPSTRSVLPITLTLKLGTSSETNYPVQNTD